MPIFLILIFNIFIIDSNSNLELCANYLNLHIRIFFSSTCQFFVFLLHSLRDFLNCIFHQLLFKSTFMFLIAKSSCLSHVCTNSHSLRILMILMFSSCIASVSSKVLLFFLFLFPLHSLLKTFLKCPVILTVCSYLRMEDWDAGERSEQE